MVGPAISVGHIPMRNGYEQLKCRSHSDTHDAADACISFSLQWDKLQEDACS